MIIAGKPTSCRGIPARKEQKDLQDLQGANYMEIGLPSSPALPSLHRVARKRDKARTYMGG